MLSSLIKNYSETHLKYISSLKTYNLSLYQQATWNVKAAPETLNSYLSSSGLHSHEGERSDTQKAVITYYPMFMMRKKKKDS